MKLWQPVALFAGLLVALYGGTGYGWDKKGEFEAVVASVGQEREAASAKLKQGKKA